MCISVYVHLCVHKDHYNVEMGTEWDLPSLRLRVGVNNLLSIKIKCCLYK